MVVAEIQRAHLANEWLAYGPVLVLGAILWFLCARFPAELPFWMPWEFSWPVYLTVALSLLWFLRGLAALPRAQRPPVWRSAAFLLGVASIYAVLQTRVDYFAQHMFFVHRWAHFVLHHAGAFLVRSAPQARCCALACPKLRTSSSISEPSAAQSM
jgi:putative membrane protein